MNAKFEVILAKSYFGRYYLNLRNFEAGEVHAQDLRLIQKLRKKSPKDDDVGKFL